MFVVSNTFEGYLQFQYTIFGKTHYGLANAYSSGIVFLSRLPFRSQGYLSMRSQAAGWGINLTLLNVLEPGFRSVIVDLYRNCIRGFFGGSFLFYYKKELKKHFSFTYFNFGMQLLFICTLAGI